MECASKYVFVGEENEQQEVFDDETLNREEDRRKKEKKKKQKSGEEEEFLALSDDEETYNYNALPKERIRKVRKADPNILAINLGTLAEEAVNVFTGDPVFCSSCSAAVTKNSTLEEGDKGQIWICEYCGEKNQIIMDQEEVPKGETTDYLLASSAPTSDVHDIVVFCIDISGSMCCTSEVTGDLKIKVNQKLTQELDQFIERNGGIAAQQFLPGENRSVTYISRLQCVQAAVVSQIQLFSKEHPQKRVAIVTFNNDVTIYLPDGTRHVVTGDKLSDFDHLSDIVNQLNLKVEQPVSASLKSLTDIVQGLEESGATALGPGLLCSISLAGLTRGSSVVLCTDGVANIGLGALDSGDNTTAINFYRRVIDTAVQKGVAVSVISIKGTNTSLEQLALVSAETKGYNDVVDPLNLNQNFNFILQNSIIATDASATMFLNRGLTFRNEKNATNSKATRIIGNCTKETAITFEYYPVESQLIKDLKNVHFQVQIHFTKLDGTKCLRVMSKTAEVTHNRQEAEKYVNVNVVGIHSHVQAAQLAAEGKYTKARMKQKANMRMVRRGIKEEGNDEQTAQYALWNKEATRFNSAIKATKINEKKKGYHYDSAEEDVSDKDEKEEIFGEKERKSERDREMEALKREKEEMRKEKEERKTKREQERKKHRYEDDSVSNVLFQAQNPLFSAFTFNENPLYTEEKKDKKK